MKNVASLGDLFPVSNVPNFVPATPNPFDPAISERLLKESVARQRNEQKFNSARNYRKLFTRLTNKKLSVEIEERFSILADEFSKLAILEVVEYMAIKSTDWEVTPFFAYLLKALQGNRRQQLQATYENPGDKLVRTLDKTVNRKMMKHNMELRRWYRERRKQASND